MLLCKKVCSAKHSNDDVNGIFHMPQKWVKLEEVIL
jgi:hypothetical protein